MRSMIVLVLASLLTIPSLGEDNELVHHADDPTWFSDGLAGTTWLLEGMTMHQEIVKEQPRNLTGKAIIVFGEVTVTDEHLHLDATLTVQRSQHFRFQYDVEEKEWKIVAVGGPRIPFTANAGGAQTLSSINGETRALERDLGRILRRATSVTIRDDGSLEISGRQGTVIFAHGAPTVTTTPSARVDSAGRGLRPALVAPRELVSQVQEELGPDGATTYKKVMEELLVGLHFKVDANASSDTRLDDVSVTLVSQRTGPNSPRLRVTLDFEIKPGSEADQTEDATTQPANEELSYRVDLRLKGYQNGAIVYDVIDVKPPPSLRGNKAQNVHLSATAEVVHDLMTKLMYIHVSDFSSSEGPSVKLESKLDGQGHNNYYFLKVDSVH